jgi:hypothetical protein
MHLSAPVATRLAAGIMLLVVGLDKLFGFFPLPTGTEAADAFDAALRDTGYMMLLVGMTELAAAAAFLSGRYVALGAVIATPVSVNAFLFHFCLSPSAMLPTATLMILNLMLLWMHRERYREILKP